MRQQLQQLSKSELIEIILQQQAVIEQQQARILQQQGLSEQLQARVAELEEQIKRLLQPPKDSSNSSIPPSKTQKPNRSQSKPKKKRGPKPGHRGRSRKRQEPDVTLECRPAQCLQCGADLDDTPAKLVGTNQVVELPPVKPLVIEARRYQVTCPVCGDEQSADYPSGLERERTFGPGIEALVCYLHHVQHISYERLQKLMRQVFGLRISEGAIANIIRRATEKLRPQAERIRRQVRASPVIGSDETGARVDGVNHWQWVFETAQASYHVIVPSRAGKVIEQVLGAARPEVWISDCFSAQLKAPAQRRQLCLAHQVRNLQYGIDVERCSFCYRMQQLLHRAMRLGKRRVELPAAVFASQVQQVEAACDALLDAEVSTETGRRLRKRYVKHRDDLFTFLHRQDVAADNNACERALRKPVVHRKVSGGFRSAWGAEAYATMSTVLQTAQKRGQDGLTTLLDVLGPSPPLNPHEHTR